MSKLVLPTLTVRSGTGHGDDVRGPVGPGAGWYAGWFCWYAGGAWAGW
jgi:hypothetical protein